MFDPDDNPTRNDVAWFLMADFLRLSPLSGGLGPIGLSCSAHCESYVQDIQTIFLVIRVDTKFDKIFHTC